MDMFLFFIWFDIVLAILIIGVFVYYWFFDTRLRLFIFKPNKQFTIYKLKIKDETASILDKNTGTNKKYTINRDFIYYKWGRIPYAFFWDNIPIPIDLSENMQLKLSTEETKFLSKLESKHGIQININKPISQLKKNINIDTAETFFRILNTNLTLNLLKPPKEFKQVIKWTMILMVIGGIVLLILHFTGYINIQEIISGTPTT